MFWTRPLGHLTTTVCSALAMSCLRSILLMWNISYPCQHCPAQSPLLQTTTSAGHCGMALHELHLSVCGIRGTSLQLVRPAVTTAVFSWKSLTAADSAEAAKQRNRVCCWGAMGWIFALQGVKWFDPRSLPDSSVLILLMATVTLLFSLHSFPSWLLTCCWPFFFFSLELAVTQRMT